MYRNVNDALLVSYEYSGLNHRIKKTVGGIVTKSFFSKNWQELESVKEAGTSVPAEITTYIWGLRYIDDLILRERGTERLYSLADPNWNVAAIVDANGAVTERMKYDAFGKRTVMSGVFVERTASEYDWNRAFTGQVFDAETGLMLYRNRYYNTGLGRFVTRDPIGYKARDLNLFRYVKNRIINTVDSDGLYIRCACGCSWGRVTVLNMPDYLCAGETPANCCGRHCTDIGCKYNASEKNDGPAYPPLSPPQPPVTPSIPPATEPPTTSGNCNPPCIWSGGNCGYCYTPGIGGCVSCNPNDLQSCYNCCESMNRRNGRGLQNCMTECGAGTAI